MKMVAKTSTVGRASKSSTYLSLYWNHKVLA
jgi:hypothetical protein